jgi:hypothetical protein
MHIPEEVISALPASELGKSGKQHKLGLSDELHMASAMATPVMAQASARKSGPCVAWNTLVGCAIHTPTKTPAATGGAVAVKVRCHDTATAEEVFKYITGRVSCDGMID